MSKIKASTLLRNVELASLGAIRDMIADEVERLETVERPIAALDEVIKHDIKPDELPTQYIDNVQLGCEIEWAIYGTGGNMWLCPSTAGREYTWRAEPFYARRWESRNGAQSYINIHKIDAAIPFPVPKLREA